MPAFNNSSFLKVQSLVYSQNLNSYSKQQNLNNYATASRGILRTGLQNLPWKTVSPTDNVSHLYITRASKQNTPSITAMKKVSFNMVYSVLCLVTLTQYIADHVETYTNYTRHTK